MTLKRSRSAGEADPVEAQRLAVFSGDTNAYIAGPTAYRDDSIRLDEWVIAFASAAELAAANAVCLADDVEAVDHASVEQLLAYWTERGLSPAAL